MEDKPNFFYSEQHVVIIAVLFLIQQDFLISEIVNQGRYIIRKKEREKKRQKTGQDPKIVTFMLLTLIGTW